MNRIWRRLTGSELIIHPGETPPVEMSAAYPPMSSLESIGMHNETLRAQIENIELGFDHFESVKGAFRGLLSPLAELLLDLETTKKHAYETSMKLDLLRDAHESLSARHQTMLGEFDALAEDRNAQQRENRELQQRTLRLEATLTAAQAEFRDATAAKERIDRLFEVEKRRTAARDDEIGRLKAQLVSNDETIAGLELSLKAAGDEGALMAREHATLRDSHQNLIASFDAVSQRVVDYESLNDQNGHRIGELEQGLSNEQSKHAALRAKHLEHLERSRSEISTLSNAIQAVRGRADVAEKILGETRGQFREKTDELRAAERRLLENAIQIDGLEKSARAAKDDLVAVNDRVAGGERIRLGLSDQVNNLSNTLKSKEIALQAATDKIEQLSARFEEAAKGAQRDGEESARAYAALKEAFDREHAERNLAEGALQASRAERQLTRRLSPVIGEGRGAFPAVRLSDETAPDSGLPPPPSNVTQLPSARALL
jgi:chromosome segregation ATPase